MLAFTFFLFYFSDPTAADDDGGIIDTAEAKAEAEAEAEAARAQA